MAKKPETVLPDEQLPTEGGSYIRQPDGVLELQERTQENASAEQNTDDDQINFNA